MLYAKQSEDEGIGKMGDGRERRKKTWDGIEAGKYEMRQLS
jgi:hypothetical protein